MCRSNGSLFYQKSLNMGPVVLQKKKKKKKKKKSFTKNFLHFPKDFLTKLDTYQDYSKT